MMVPENYQQQNIHVHDPLSNPKFGVEGSSALTGATRVPQRIGQTSITSGMPNSVEAGAGLFRLPGGKYCRCGGCQWCMENTRWDRILVRRSELLWELNRQAQVAGGPVIGPQGPTSQGFALISQDNRYNTVRPEKAHMR